MESKKILQMELDAIEEALEDLDEEELTNPASWDSASKRKLLIYRQARLAKRMEHAK